MEVYDGHTNELKTWDDVVKLIYNRKILSTRNIVKIKTIHNDIEYKSRSAVATREIRNIVANLGFNLYQT